MSTARPLVGVIMGSTSDWEACAHATEMLERLGVPHEARVVSAHRTPDLLFEYAETRGGARPRGADRRRRRRRPPAGHGRRQDAAAGARGAGAVAALSGLDSLLSIVQMPAGVPVGTLAIGQAGAINAALLAAAILARSHRELRARARALPRASRPTRARTARPANGLTHRAGRIVGVLGGGQLGRMLALAAAPLGVAFRFLDPAADACAGDVARADRRRATTTGRARAARRRRRLRHLRVRERAGGGARRAARPDARASRRRAPDGLAGSAAGEAAVRARRGPDCAAFARRRHARPSSTTRSRARPAGGHQDRAHGLRRQGPARRAHGRGGRCGRRRARRRADRSRRSSASGASCRSCSCAGVDPRPSSTRSSRTSTSTASCRRARPGARASTPALQATCEGYAGARRRGARPRRGARLELFADRPRACSRTSSHRASTTRATGRSRARRRASSRTTCARCSACRSGRPRRAGGRDAEPRRRASAARRSCSPQARHVHLYGKEPRPGRKLGHVTHVERPL